ncbi:MAG: acetyl-CoA synthetase [Haloferacaceae archaeon]
MEFSVLGDLLARERRSERPALVVPRLDREMRYHDLLTTAYKAGNALRYLGVSRAATVAVDPTPAPEPILAFLGAAQLGATTTFDPFSEARVTLVPVADEERHVAPPGSTLVVYGGPPSAPATIHWEEAVWSENPGAPRTDVDPDAPAVLADGRTHSHAALLAAADRVVADLGLTASSRLAVRTSLEHPETVLGVLAALAAGAAAVLVAEPTRDVDADAALVEPGVDPPEATWLSTADVALS